MHFRLDFEKFACFSEKLLPAPFDDRADIVLLHRLMTESAGRACRVFTKSILSCLYASQPGSDMYFVFLCICNQSCDGSRPFFILLAHPQVTDAGLLFSVVFCPSIYLQLFRRRVPICCFLPFVFICPGIGSRRQQGLWKMWAGTPLSMLRRSCAQAGG